MLITQISNQFLLWYLRGHFSLQTLNLLTFQIIWLSRRSKQKKTPIQRKNWNTGLYCSLADHASYYFNRKVLVYNGYLFKIHMVTVSYRYLSFVFNCKRHMLRWYILIFVIFRLKFHISTFLKILEYVLSFHFSHNILRQSKDTIKFALKYRSKEPPLIFHLLVIR